MKITEELFRIHVKTRRRYLMIFMNFPVSGFQKLKVLTGAGYMLTKFKESHSQS